MYLTGMVGGIVIGSALGGVAASAWGITAPFWFGFAGSAIILAFIWRSLPQIAHADEDLRADAPTARTPERQTSQATQTPTYDSETVIRFLTDSVQAALA